ncbi:MAG: hypothetical protein E7259_00730 [Lachnospiraceae bacterium]|nr:hypothetical protein [Lachnospiraceae bacterium]
MRGENNRLRAQLRGRLFELALIKLLESSDFAIVDPVNEMDTRVKESRDGFIEFKGRGCWHQIDLPFDYNRITPFSYPMRLIGELLMLFTVIRLHWSNRDKSLVSETLYIKDGPMTLGRQYSKLVPSIRSFLQYAKEQNRPIHIMGCEKSGTYFEHLSAISKTVDLTDGKMKYAVLNHGYIRKEVQRAPDHVNPYGSRTNWGEKVFVVLDNNTHMTLNMSTGEYNPEDLFPRVEDIIGLKRILATLPSLVSRKYEGALYPIELVNGIASMSNYPSAKILQDFVRDAIQ